MRGGIPAPVCWPPAPHPGGQEETQNLDKNSLLERYGFILLLIRGDLPPGALDLFSRRGGPEIHKGTRVCRQVWFKGYRLFVAVPWTHQERKSSITRGRRGSSSPQGDVREGQRRLAGVSGLSCYLCPEEDTPRSVLVAKPGAGQGAGQGAGGASLPLTYDRFPQAPPRQRPDLASRPQEPLCRHLPGDPGSG